MAISFAKCWRRTLAQAGRLFCSTNGTVALWLGPAPLPQAGQATDCLPGLYFVFHAKPEEVDCLRSVTLIQERVLERVVWLITWPVKCH